MSNNLLIMRDNSRINGDNNYTQWTVTFNNETHRFGLISFILYVENN